MYIWSDEYFTHSTFWIQLLLDIKLQSKHCGALLQIHQPSVNDKRQPREDQQVTKDSNIFFWIVEFVNDVKKHFRSQSNGQDTNLNKSSVSSHLLPFLDK